MSRIKLKSLVLAMAMAGTGLAMFTAPVYASAIQEKVTVSPVKSISPSEESIISSAGAKVLRHIAQARSDIHNKDAEAARTELGQANNLLNIIQEALPTTKVKDRIWVAKKHLEYEDTQDVLPDLIPIYTSLDELVDIMPVDVAKKHLDQAKKHLKAGNKKSAREELEATDASLQYTEVDLPLKTTRQLVAQSLSDLDKNALDDADKTLKSAEDGVVYLSYAIDQPLFTAKALLWQTVLDLGAGQKDQAKDDLNSAIGYLQVASESDQKPTQEAARQLLTQAKELQQDLKGGKDIGTRLHQLWEHAQAFADRSVEYMSAGWARYRTDSQPKSDLIEAKLHLTNAKIDMFTGNEANKAKEELGTAERFLTQAADQAKKHQLEDHFQNQISGLQKSVKELSADPAGSRESKYDVLQQELGKIIRSI